MLLLARFGIKDKFLGNKVSEFVPPTSLTKQVLL